MTLTPDDLEQLETLAKAATPAPWTSLRDGNQYITKGYIPAARCVGASRIEGLTRPWNPHAAIAFGLNAEAHEVVRFLDADAAFIAACSPDKILALIKMVRVEK